MIDYRYRWVGVVCAMAMITIASACPAVAAKIPRSVLKEYFQTGDKPTQSQFRDLIDSSLNLVDDGLTTYSISDSADEAPRFDENVVIGADLTFVPLADILGISDEWLSQSGFLPLAFEQDSQLHYAYLQISAPIPGAPNPWSMTVEYLVYEDLSNTALETQAVPEPSTFVLTVVGALGCAAIALARRRALRRG